ncbi:AlpA family phage regulatory protein [Paraburkholderia sediminicola]|nr:AlpA family phage regulatory protein [Paraburkholderia sediminicola]
MMIGVWRKSRLLNQSQGHDVTDPNRLLTTDEVTALTGLSRSKLYTMRLAGEFPQLATTGTKAGFYWAVQVEAWLTERRLAGGAAQ